MKTLTTFAALLGLALNGCASNLSISADKSCKQKPSGKPQTIVIQLKEKRNDKDKIEPPKEACAQPGDLLRFKIDTKNRTNASVSGKTNNTANEWINGGTNNKERWFWVTVPYDVLPEGTDEKSFFYDITVEGFPEIDPEVRVRRPK